MLEQKRTWFLSILLLSAHAFATPIVIVSTGDGFVIGTNGVDTKGLEVCKTHYAGSTVVIRATDLARVPKSPGSSEMLDDSTVEEWKILDPTKDASHISSDMEQFF